MTPIDISDSLARLAPDLPRVAVVFADLGMGPGFCLGMTGPSLWKELGLEPGPAMLLNRVALEAAAEEYLPVAGSLEEARRHEFLATAVHELGHIACLPPPYYDFGPSLGSLPQLVRLLERLPAAPPHVSGDDWSLDAMHGASWIRLTLHLRARAQRLGLYLSAANVAWHPAYGSPDCFRFALGDEPELMADWPIEQIKLAPPPAAFVNLFQPERKADMPTATLEPEPRIAASRADREITAADRQEIAHRYELKARIKLKNEAETRRLTGKRGTPDERLADAFAIEDGKEAEAEFRRGTSPAVLARLRSLEEDVGAMTRTIGRLTRNVRIAEQNMDIKIAKGQPDAAERHLDRRDDLEREKARAEQELAEKQAALAELREYAMQPEAIKYEREPDYVPGHGAGSRVVLAGLGQAISI